jgi:predicted dinucleotide-utilizing enzyme
MEISPRALGRRRVIAAQPARSDKRDRRVTVGGGACGTVDGVISAKVEAVGLR